MFVGKALNGRKTGLQKRLFAITMAFCLLGSLKICYIAVKLSSHKVKFWHFSCTNFIEVVTPPDGLHYLALRLSIKKVVLLSVAKCKCSAPGKIKSQLKRRTWPWTVSSHIGPFHHKGLFCPGTSKGAGIGCW